LEVTFLIVPARTHLLAEAWRSAHSSPPAGNRCVMASAFPSNAPTAAGHRRLPVGLL
jgi:hypothetical protein